MSKALLERLDLTQTHTFSIVTLGEGQCSLPAHVSFTDILTPDHLRDSDARSLPDTSIDSSTAERRVVRINLVSRVLLFLGVECQTPQDVAVVTTSVRLCVFLLLMSLHDRNWICNRMVRRR